MNIYRGGQRIGEPHQFGTATQAIILSTYYVDRGNGISIRKVVELHGNGNTLHKGVVLLWPKIMQRIEGRASTSKIGCKDRNK